MLSHLLRRHTITGLVALALPACATRNADPDPACTPAATSTSGWQQIDAGEFSFRLPPGFTAAEVQGIDSRVGAYRSSGNDAEVTFDMGWYSNDLSFDSTTFTEYRRCTSVIDGRTATVVTAQLRNPSPVNGRHVAAAAWRDVNDGEPPVHLTVWTTAQNPDRIPELLAVLNSVDFDE